MYVFLTQVHHYLSWLVLAALLYAVVRSWIGFTGRKEWTSGDGKSSLLVTILFDIQVLVGIILYGFLSPLTKAAFADFGAAMGNSMLRFYAVEHILVMIIALALIHIGRSKMKKISAGWRKHKVSAIFLTVALLLVLSRIPWDKFARF
ncbi:MAG: hypothetical protein ACOZDD_01950 [Bacteroidota bacterium]